MYASEPTFGFFSPLVGEIELKVCRVVVGEVTDRILECFLERYVFMPIL
jgi:hypothetical protein